MPSPIALFMHHFSAEEYIFGADFCLGKHIFQLQICNSDFQPPLIHEFCIHTSALCLIEDGLMLEQPTPHLLEGVNCVLHADLPLERHTYDVLQVVEDMPYSFSGPYISPLQQWVDYACECTCQCWHNICISIHPHELDAMSCNDVIFVPTHNHFVFNVSLFWFIAKHKGRLPDVNKRLGWLHWKYDYT
jgi:hypothetical protein